MLVAVLDATDTHHAGAVHALREALGRGDRLVLPASAYAEMLMAPHRRGGEAVDTAGAFVEALPAAVEPISRGIAARAADLNARHGARLRLPDALVAATADVLKATLVVTTDAGSPGLPVPVALFSSERR